MNIKKSLIVAAVFMSASAAVFAQTPAQKPAKKEKAKTEKPAADTAKPAHKMHKHAAPKAQ
ncbi:hypothetical protein [Chitinophaga filiformis]|uniref:Acid shock protein n=1 Tax=Chitinophaga filiformis TaxID=104663 RepID=A0A1G8DBT7_CHIFI|nr:hypothetical protein [Chitinophaga filiformis]SDH55172.1 hypothetical protein SAMN04488121_11462 [Chitinophaga filiformis]